MGEGMRCLKKGGFYLLCPVMGNAESGHYTSAGSRHADKVLAVIGQLSDGFLYIIQCQVRPLFREAIK